MKSDELNTWRSLPVISELAREVCKQCSKPLAVELQRERDDIDMWDKFKEIRRTHNKFKRGKVMKWRYKSHGHFCTYRCATVFANRIIDSNL